MTCSLIINLASCNGEVVFSHNLIRDSALYYFTGFEPLNNDTKTQVDLSKQNMMPVTEYVFETAQTFTRHLEYH